MRVLKDCELFQISGGRQMNITGFGASGLGLGLRFYSNVQKGDKYRKKHPRTRTGRMTHNKYCIVH